MGKSKALWTIFGFLLAGTGFLALVLSVVGVQLSFLTWIDAPGAFFGFLIRLMMILMGFVIVYLSTTKWEA